MPFIAIVLERLDHAIPRTSGPSEGSQTFVAAAAAQILALAPASYHQNPYFPCAPSPYPCPLAYPYPSLFPYPLASPFLIRMGDRIRVVHH